jgi:hypothetical protein
MNKNHLGIGSYIHIALIIIMLVESNGKKSLWKEFLLLNKLHCSILKVFEFLRL